MDLNSTLWSGKVTFSKQLLLLLHYAAFIVKNMQEVRSHSGILRHHNKQKVHQRIKSIYV